MCNSITFDFYDAYFYFNILFRNSCFFKDISSMKEHLKIFNAFKSQHVCLNGTYLVAHLKAP